MATQSQPQGDRVVANSRTCNGCGAVAAAALETCGRCGRAPDAPPRRHKSAIQVLPPLRVTERMVAATLAPEVVMRQARAVEVTPAPRSKRGFFRRLLGR